MKHACMIRCRVQHDKLEGKNSRKTAARACGMACLILPVPQLAFSYAANPALNDITAVSESTSLYISLYSLLCL
jgi:hypothetical protein